MPSTIFTQTLWRPGEPLEPNADQLGNLELTQRLMHLEKSLDGLEVGDLPVADLEKELEQTWLPDPSTLFASGSVTSEVLDATTFYGRVGSAGTIVLGGSGDWSVVRNGAGDYTITFPALKNVPVVTALPMTAITGLRNPATTLTTAQVVMSADSDFNFVVRGK